MNAASSKKESPPKPATPLTPRLITSIELEAPGYSEPCIGGVVPFSSVDWPHRLATALFSKRLAQVLHYLDWVGLDVKTHASGHDQLTGRPRSHAPMNACLDMLLAWQGNFECRTTWSPD